MRTTLLAAAILFVIHVLQPSKLFNSIITADTSELLKLNEELQSQDDDTRKAVLTELLYNSFWRAYSADYRESRERTNRLYILLRNREEALKIIFSSESKLRYLTNYDIPTSFVLHSGEALSPYIAKLTELLKKDENSSLLAALALESAGHTGRAAIPELIESSIKYPNAENYYVALAGLDAKEAIPYLTKKNDAVANIALRVLQIPNEPSANEETALREVYALQGFSSPLILEKCLKYTKHPSPKVQKATIVCVDQIEFEFSPAVQEVARFLLDKHPETTEYLLSNIRGYPQNGPIYRAFFTDCLKKATNRQELIAKITKPSDLEKRILNLY